MVFNLWHGDERGAVTDRSYALRVDDRGESTRTLLPQPLEAPFGGAVADLEIIEKLFCPLLSLFGRPTGKVEDEGYIFCRRQEGQQVVRLKDEANLI